MTNLAASPAPGAVAATAGAAVEASAGATVEATLLRALRSLAGQRTLDDLAASALAAAVELTAATRGLVAFADGEILRCAADYDATSGAIRRPGAALDDGLDPDIRAVVDHVTRSGCAFTLGAPAGPGDDGCDALAERLRRAAAPPGAALCLPVQIPGQEPGLLYVAGATPLSDPADQAVRALADHLAFAAATVARERALEARVAALDGQLAASRRDLDEFAQWVSHDLRTPLTSILGFTQILLEDWGEMPADESEHLLAMIDQAGMRMTHILDEFLVITRLRTGDVARAVIDMAELVGQMRVRLASVFRRCDARVGATEEVGDWPMAMGYRPWLEAVWGTLIRSALERGGEPPRVDFGAAAQGDGSVRYWVRANGPGPTPEDLRDLEEVGDGASAASGSGRVLGLALVKQVIAVLAGDFGVDRATPGATTYYFTLPAAP